MFRVIRWIDTVADEFYGVAIELAGLLDVVKIQRRARRRQLVVTLTLPRLGRTLTFSLLAVGISGITYALSPAISSSYLAAPSHKTPVQSLKESPKQQLGLVRSTPTNVKVPSVGINADLITLGKNPDGSLATPERYDIAGWYKFAPTPGEIGPAIIVGHVDNYLGPAVFYELKNLQPDQSIFVTRQDNQIVEFRVESVELFDQQRFPTAAVYGNIDYPGLRLITCGGKFNPLTGHYSHNTVVYARMRAS